MSKLLSPLMKTIDQEDKEGRDRGPNQNSSPNESGHEVLPRRQGVAFGCTL